MQRIVLGIDFGMCNSRIAYIDEYHKPLVIYNQENKPFTPSVIHFHDKDSYVVGDEALIMPIVDPQNTVAFIKRNMGRPGFKLSIHDREYTPQEISALILKKLKEDAESYFTNQGIEAEVKDAVITVPAYFLMQGREAIKEAGEIAGLNVLTIINEPTAAALAYGINKLGKDQTVFVFDLGGGTFDVTILEINGNGINMIASDGDPELGGKDWDDLLTSHCSCLFKEKYGNDPLYDPNSYQELYDRVVKAKILLSTKPKCSIQVSHAGNSENVEITREKFEELSKDLLAQCKSLSERVLKKAKKEWSDIDTVLLVGGSTYMPMIRNMIKEISGKELSTVVNPDQCVAIGAAYQGHNKYYTDAVKNILSEERKEALGNKLDVQKKADIIDNRKTPTILSRNIGFSALDSNGKENVHLLFQKDTKLPAEKNESFTFAYDKQSSVALQLLEGIGDIIKDYSKIGDFIIEFKSVKKKQAVCGITFAIPQDGILEVNVKCDNEEIIKKFQFATTSFGNLAKKTFYEILGVSENADYAEIKKVHDDKYKIYLNTRDKVKAVARWVPVSEAWECLRDPIKRKEYDSHLRKA